VISNVEKTLEAKQNEYILLLASKDEEIKYLSDEIIRITDSCEQVKKDRIKDQRILHDYETENHYLSSRLQELTGKSNENYLSDSSAANKNLLNRIEVKYRLIKPFSEKWLLQRQLLIE
jgi:hypothetical protein